MAKACKCDLCGQLYEHYEGCSYDGHGIRFNQIKLSNGSYERTFDTCPLCMQFVLDLMESMKEEED